MSRYVAFLRGINLGKRRIKMADLAELFKELGYEDVATYIASGNVLFDTAAGEEEIVAAVQNHLHERLGYEVDTFVRTMDELYDIARRDVFSGIEEFQSRDESEWRLHVTFLREAPDSRGAEAIHSLETDDDRFEIRGRELYWLRRGRLSDSSIAAGDMTRALRGASGTMRNMNTVERIIKKFGAGA